MPDTPLASALVLVGQTDAALWLSSRAGLPTYVEVMAARTNPLFGFCPSVRVELWTVGLATTGQQARRLDTKTFALSDPWDIGELMSPWGTTLDCLNTTTLQPGAYTGPVVFLLCEPNGDEIGRSGPISLATLPDGAALDEQPDILDPILNPIQEAGEKAWSLAKVATVAGVLVGGLILAPQIRALVGGVIGDD